MQIDNTRLPAIIFYNNGNIDVFWNIEKNYYIDFHGFDIVKTTFIDDIKSIIYLDEIQSKFPDQFKD